MPQPWECSRLDRTLRSQVQWKASLHGREVELGDLQKSLLGLCDSGAPCEGRTLPAGSHWEREQLRSVSADGIQAGVGFKCHCSSWLQLWGELDRVQWYVLGPPSCATVTCFQLLCSQR